MTTTDSPSAADILARAGLRPDFPAKNAPPDAIASVLENLPIALEGASPTTRTAVIAKAKTMLRPHGVTAAAVVAAASKLTVAVAEDQTDEPPDDDSLLSSGVALLEASDVLAAFRVAIKAEGFAGETAPAELIYLALHSRYSAQPVNIAARGQSAAGKSFVVRTACKYHPPEATYEMTAASERALVYSDENMQHRYLIVAEAAGLENNNNGSGVGATILRELAWGGKIRYATVDKEDGEMRGRVIEKPGPTGLITTSVRDIDAEMLTRLVELRISDSAQQTREVMTAAALRARDGETPDADLTPWHAASRWLLQAGDKQVRVPFAVQLVELLPDDDVRLRRDVRQILTLIGTHAYLHQRTRPRADDGAVLAVPTDYAAVHRLLAGAMAVTLDEGASQATRDTVNAVALLIEMLQLKEHDGVSHQQLAQHLKIGRRTASDRVRRARRAGFLADLEERRGYPARLRLGDPLPPVRSVLPDPALLVRDSHTPTLPEVVATSGVGTGSAGGSACDGTPSGTPGSIARNGNELHGGGSAGVLQPELDITSALDGAA